MCKIPVRVIANASRRGVISFCDGVLKIKVMAPADGGRANAEILEFLGKKLGAKNIFIVSGQRSRNKVIDFGDDFSLKFILDKLFSDDPLRTE
ncbi:MAG: DUF167 domain-containing protein [Puniceicoccales bacterium]|nr:DUF167 domain-containing protein [Puniceicoccales bacterium]